MEDSQIDRGNCRDARELKSKNLQIRLLGHCIICLRKVSAKRKKAEVGTSEYFRVDGNCGSSTQQPEIAPKCVVTTPGFLTTFNQVWTVLYAKWREKNTRAKDDGTMEEIEIGLESVLQAGSVSANVSFSKAPTICQLCCDKVLAVENLMKPVRQQVREIGMLLEEGRKRQEDGGFGNFEINLREEGLEENVIRATLQFVGVFGSSRCSEQKANFQANVKGGQPNAAAVSMPNMVECDEDNSIVSSQIDSDDNIEGQTGDWIGDDDDPDYVKSEEEPEEDDKEDGRSADEMEVDDEDDKNDPDYEVGEDPLTVTPKKRKRDSSNKSPRKRAAKSELTIRNEKETNEVYNKFPCSCGKSFANRKRRDVHIRLNKSSHPEYKRYGNIELRSWPTCELCGEKVVFSDLRQHYTDHLNGQAEWVLRCPNEKCEYIGVTSDKLSHHLRSGKNKECRKIWIEKGGLVCDTCGFKGTNLFNLKNHVRDKHEIGGEKNLRCPISGCGKMFTLKQSVHEHMLEHQCCTITQQICDKCGKDLKVEEMEGHLREEHGIEEVIGCGQCEMKFSGKDEMVDHLYEHRKIGIRCDVCGENKFGRYVDFREHYFGVHKLCPKKYKCGEEDCDLWFWKNEVRGIHELRMHKESKESLRYKKSLAGERGKGEKRFGCDVCNVRFVTEVSLIKHNIKVHGEDPFRCDICGETFNEKQKLNRHKKEHAGIPVQKEWRCEVEGCGKIFKEKRFWKRHLETGHGAVKKHVCEICGKGYADQQTLKDHHDIVHLGLRPWVCDECGERFTSSTVLKRHKLIHSGERPFGCDICGQRFRHKEVLRRHLVGHEKKGADFKPNGPMKQIRKRKAL